MTDDDSTTSGPGGAGTGEEAFRAREISITKPSAARLYDWYLGGSHNYAIDKAFGARIVEIFPLVRDFARHNREFLGRAVRFCAEQGIRQFLDIGSGVPTVGNVHEVAHAIDPSIRVVYVDNDMEAVISSEQLLKGVDTATVIAGDLFQPNSILTHPETTRLINPDEPLALLIVGVLHFVLDDRRPHELLRFYRDWLPSGSYFVASHGTVDEASPVVRAQLEGVRDAYADTANPSTIRTKAEFTRFFDGLDLVEPGVAFAVDWRSPTPVDLADPARPTWYAAVGRKP
jgi:hypothetical protein